MLSRLQARAIAEQQWGDAGQGEVATNREGAYYFSCSSHGGFVIDNQALTGAERRLLAEAGFSSGGHGRADCWTFEEDAEWAAVYLLTGIRTEDGFAAPEAEVIAAALRLLKNHYPQAAAVAERTAIRQSGPGTASRAKPAPPGARPSPRRTARPTRAQHPPGQRRAGQ